MTALARVGVAGTGAWGTALAEVAARNHPDVVMWGIEEDAIAAIDRDHRNPTYLGDLALNEGIGASTEAAVLGDVDALLMVVPAQALGGACETLASVLPENAPVVICAKGVERGTNRLMSEVVAAALPGRPIAILSGPSFAAEVAAGRPTAVTIACADAELGAALAERLSGPAFRPYWSADIIGTQIGGAVKNPLAIACGIATGRGLGDSARAALITRGLAEIGRLSAALGGDARTLMGLSGLGDLVLTCSSAQSRNFSFGLAVGEGHTVADVLAKGGTVEGVASAAAVTDLAGAHDLDMPITAAVNAVVHHGADIDQTIAALLARPLKTEAG